MVEVMTLLCLAVMMAVKMTVILLFCVFEGKTALREIQP